MRSFLAFLANLFRRREPVMTEVFPDAAKRPPPRRRASRVPVRPAPYRVFTREFDRIIDATELDTYLDPVPSDYGFTYDNDWKKYQAALADLRLKSAVMAMDASADIRHLLSTESLSDTAVVILVDQSGSMLGQPMVLTAAALDVAQDFLGHLGCTVEVLGFTTATWMGGRSKQKWQRAGKPPNPGRLCDLLHIVHRHADGRQASPEGWSVKAMLHPGLLKENVDGEALEWAAGRLRTLPQSRKLLVVVSDGAPADDATLKANDAGYLHRHLRQVTAWLEAAPDLSLVAIGIGYDVARYYGRSVKVNRADELGETLIGLLHSILADEPVRPRRRPAGGATVH